MVNNYGNSQGKHNIDIRYNLSRVQVKHNLIMMKHLQTKDITSDILTKPLAGTLVFAKYVCSVYFAINHRTPNF